MYEDILKAYSNSDIVQICRYLNKDYNIYDPEEVRWKKIRYAFSKTPAKDLIDLQEKTSSNEFINHLLMKYYMSRQESLCYQRLNEERVLRSHPNCILNLRCL